MMRWGEAYTHALHSARDEAGRIKLKELDYSVGIVARLEPGNFITVDVPLKRYAISGGNYFDHPISIVAFSSDDHGVGVGDIVLLENEITKQERENPANEAESSKMKYPPYMYENLHIQYMKGNPKPDYVSIFGDENGWGTDKGMELAYMKQIFQPKTHNFDSTHYKPHANPVFGQNRVGEKASTLSAQAEIRGKSGSDEKYIKDLGMEGEISMAKVDMIAPTKYEKFNKEPLEYSMNYQRSEPIYLNVTRVIQRAGFGLCPIHECRTQHMDYIEPNVKYPEAQLTPEQIQQHKQKIETLRNREWQPEYFNEIAHNSVNSIELSHENFTEEPDIQGRKATHAYLQPATAYEPDLNYNFTFPGTYPETVQDKIGENKVDEVFKWSRYDHASDRDKEAKDFEAEKLDFMEKVRAKMAESSEKEESDSKSKFAMNNVGKDGSRNLMAWKRRQGYRPKYTNLEKSGQYYRDPQIRQMPDAQTNMSNRVKEPRANPHDKKWKLR